jgi:hypothetical protein
MSSKTDMLPLGGGRTEGSDGVIAIYDHHSDQFLIVKYDPGTPTQETP